jgi:hypothetical protein
MAPPFWSTQPGFTEAANGVEGWATTRATRAMSMTKARMAFSYQRMIDKPTPHLLNRA